MRMFKGRVLGALTAAVVSIALSCGVSAGPFADFERALAAAYGPFKAALFQTNQKDKAGTDVNAGVIFHRRAGAIIHQS